MIKIPIKYKMLFIYNFEYKLDIFIAISHHDSPLIVFFYLFKLLILLKYVMCLSSLENHIPFN